MRFTDCELLGPWAR